MNSFFSLFSKKTINLPFPNIPPINKLKKFNNNIYIFNDLTIYHNSNSIYIPLLILDFKHGIYIFEHKKWSFEYLKNSTVDKSINQNRNKDNLFFNKIDKFIIQKFNDMTNTDGIKVFNFLLCENLTANEYDRFDDSIKEFLPKHRLIFTNYCEESILKTLQNTPDISLNKEEISSLMGSLLVQYLIINGNKRFLATQEQKDFIDASIRGHQTLKAPFYSGKSNSLVLKAIYEKLKNPKHKTMIIAPTKTDCNLLKQKLLSIVEHSMITIDILSIKIITPIELLNIHLKELKKELLDEELFIEDTLMRKKFYVADMIMCDDSDLLTREFISYLIHIQKNSSLLLVSSEALFDKQQIFKNSFRSATQKFIFEKIETYPRALQIIKELLQNHTTNDILILSTSIEMKNFIDDLNFYMYGKSSLLDGSINLIDHNLKNLTISSYDKLSSIRYKFVILLEIDLASINELVHASNLSKESVYYLYDEECQNINILREKFETKTK